MKILIVEDEANIRFVLKYNLELDEHEVVLAENGQEGVAAADESIDLILMDIMMPVMNGLEAVKKLKGNPATKDIPIFMLTAKSQFKDIEKAFKTGADDYITKPFDPSELNAKIQKRLELYRKKLRDE